MSDEEIMNIDTCETIRPQRAFPVGAKGSSLKSKLSMAQGRRGLTRIIFWCILILFILSAVWWTFYLPYDEDALYRAIPANALVVSEHDNLSERWQQILGNNAVRRSVQILAGESVSLDRIARDKSIKWVCDHFAFKKTLFALVPALGSDVQSTSWVFSSWVGGNGQYLKRGVIAREMRELKKQKLEDGRVIWIVAKEDIGAGNLSLSLAVYDGVLLGCLSEDPMAVRYLLYRMQGRITSPIKYFDSDLFITESMTDKVWVSRWFLREVTGYNDIRAGFVDVGKNHIQGRVYIENILSEDFNSEDNSINIPATSREISSILKVRPELLTISNLRDLSFSSDMPFIKDVINGVKSYDNLFAKDAPIFVGLFGGDVSGRIMGLRIPTIVIGIKVKEPLAIIANIDNILDSINSTSGWGLIPGRMGVGETAKIGINSTRGGIYNSIKVEQRPAIKVVGDWLVLASNANALDNVVTVQPDTALVTTLWPVWLPENINGVGTSYLWSEFRPAGKSVRNALAVWSLSLSVSGGKNKVIKKNMIQQAREIITVLQELGAGTVWVKPQNTGVMIDFNVED